MKWSVSLTRCLFSMVIGCAIAVACALSADPSVAADRAFPRGATPSPPHKLLAAPQHKPVAAPPQIAYVPKQLDYWGNDRFGDCVSAEEAFCKACYQPEIFIQRDEVVRWARRHGYLNGADLASVLESMQKDGFQIGSQTYNDGGYSSVNYSDEPTLQSAIALGPVKIAIDANALPSGAGNQTGWYAIGGGSFPNTDHCVSICGYGTADYLFSQISTPLPAAVPGATPGYLVYTWSTIGFVDHAWLMSTTTEAWVRNPPTVGVPPLPAPSPGPGPGPGPLPIPTPSGSVTFSEAVQLVIAAAKPNLTQTQAAAIADFFSDDNSPRVGLLKTIAYHRALRDGAIASGTSIDAVNWQQLIQFLNALMPLIEQMIVLFGGDTPHAAMLEHDQVGTVKLCVASPASAPKYRTECGPNGCRRVPIATTRSPSPKPKSPKPPVKPAPRKCSPSRKS